MESGAIHRRATAVVSLVTLVGFAAGCVEWRPVESPVRKTLSGRTTSSAVVIRETPEGRQEVRLHQVVVTSDSLFGYVVADRPETRAALPLADVAQVRTPHVAAGKTTLLALGLTAGGLLLVGAVVVATEGVPAW